MLLALLPVLVGIPFHDDPRDSRKSDVEQRRGVDLGLGLGS